MSGQYRLVNFGDICEHSAFGPRFSSNEYASDGNVACLRTMDMDFSGRINFDAMPIAKLDLSRLRNHILRRDDLVITRTGAYLGKAAVFSQFRLPVVAGAFSIYFRLKREIACPVFVRYFFNSSVGQAATRSIATGSAQPNLNIPLLHSLPVPLPPLPLQRKIASILSAYDDLIENNTRRIAILEEMAQAIYRDWFVNFRFPGHENVKLVQSTLGMIPERWKVGVINDVTRLLSGFAFKSETFVDAGEFRLVTIKNVHDGRFVADSDSLLDAIPDKMPQHCLLSSGNILLSLTGNIGRTCVVYGNGFLLNQRVAKLAPLIPADNGYVYCLFRSPDTQVRLSNIANGVAQQNLSPVQTGQLPHALPPRSLLDAFAQTHTPLFCNIVQLYHKNSNLRRTRDLLLPKLISGQLDVEELDIDLGIAEELGEPTANPIERKPAVRETAEIDNASTASTISTLEPIPIDELDVDQVMAEFRQQARRLGTTTRAELLKAVSQELGYKRLGHNIEEVLKGHLRAAIRRKIIAADGELVCLHTPSMETYERDELIDAFHSVMRKNISYEREDVIRALANHLGFRRISDTVREPIKSAINAAIRRGVLVYKGELIWRGD